MVTPLTPRDLLNAKRKSGYEHVVFDLPSSTTNSYRAQYKPRPARAGVHIQNGWGPRRPTALAAAQDYCDYVNGNPSATIAPTLKSANHLGKRKPVARDADYEAALGMVKDHQAQVAGKQGYVYLIAETSAVTRGVDMLWGYGKIGFSTNPPARVPELQTGNPRPLRLMGYKRGTVEDEAALHQKYIANNILQEWFRLTPAMVAEFPSDAKGKV